MIHNDVAIDTGSGSDWHAALPAWGAAHNTAVSAQSLWIGMPMTETTSTAALIQQGAQRYQLRSILRQAAKEFLHVAELTMILHLALYALSGFHCQTSEPFYLMKANVRPSAKFMSLPQLSRACYASLCTTCAKAGSGALNRR